MRKKNPLILYRFLWPTIALLLTNSAFGTCSEILEQLQVLHSVTGKTFINQQHAKVQKIGGSCGPVCAVNLLQGMRVIQGLQPVSEPFLAITDLLKKIPTLQKGGVDPQGLSDALHFLNRNYLNGKMAQIKTEFLEGVFTPSSATEDLTSTKLISIESITPKDGELKIVLFASSQESENLGHYVLVKKVTGNTLQVIEPNQPDLKNAYEMKEIQFKNGFFSNTITETVQLTPASDNIIKNVVQDKTLLVFAIFTVQ